MNSNFFIDNLVEVILRQLEASEHEAIGINIPKGHPDFTVEGFLEFIKRHNNTPHTYLDARGPFAPNFEVAINGKPARTIVYIGKEKALETLLKQALSENITPNIMFKNAFSNLPVYLIGRQHVLVADTLL